MLRFLADPRIEPTSNHAARALWPAVIVWKVSQCFKNQRGGSLFDDLPTTFRTGCVPTPFPP